MVPSAVHANFGADTPRNKKLLGTPFFPGPGRQWPRRGGGWPGAPPRRPPRPRVRASENFKVLGSGPNSVCRQVGTGRGRRRSIGAALRAGAEPRPFVPRRRPSRQRLCPGTRDVAAGQESWAASTVFKIATRLKRQKIALVKGFKMVISQVDRITTLDAVGRQRRIPIQNHANRSSAPSSNRHSYTCEGSLRRSSSARAGGGLGVPPGPRPSCFGLVPVHLAKAIEWLPGRDALRVSCKQSDVSSPPSIQSRVCTVGRV